MDFLEHAHKLIEKKRQLFEVSTKLDQARLEFIQEKKRLEYVSLSEIIWI